MEFQGKVAVITGGASGIGLATARQLAQRGVNLCLVDREPGALDVAAAELRTAERCEGRGQGLRRLRLHRHAGAGGRRCADFRSRGHRFQ